MASLKIEIDAENALDRQLTDIERNRLPFATSLAVNRVAEAVWETNRRVTQQVFDRPRPQTVKAIRYQRSNYRQDPITARVYVQDFAPKGTAPEKYLQAQALGGQRADKRSERALKAAGLMPEGTQAVPGRGVQLDQYGNIRGALLMKVLSQVRAATDKYQNQTEGSATRRRRRSRKRGGEYFALPKRRGKLLPGIYERISFTFAGEGGKVSTGSALKSILVFVRKAVYRKRYDIFSVSQKVFQRQYPEIFRKALEDALKPKPGR